MRYLVLAAFVMSCSSGAKQPAGPTPGGSGEGSGAGDPGAGQAKKPDPPPPPPDTGGYRLVPAASLKWAPLDPKKPGPELAVVSGDLQQGAGFFLRLSPGSKLGLHTHTSDYHAIVVSGVPKHWLPGEEKKAKPLGPGSYWFQPGKQPHGDECTGTEPCVLYLVVAGAFDFMPAPDAKPGKPGQYLLVERASLKFTPLDPGKPEGIKIALVSGDPKTGPVQYIIEVPPGGNSGLHSHTSEYHAIVLEGAPAHWLPHEANEGQPLAPGTYWFQPGGYDHGDRCTGTSACRAFLMLPKPFDARPPKK